MEKKKREDTVLLFKHRLFSQRGILLMMTLFVLLMTFFVTVFQQYMMPDLKHGMWLLSLLFFFGGIFVKRNTAFLVVTVIFLLNNTITFYGRKIWGIAAQIFDRFILFLKGLNTITIMQFVCVLILAALVIYILAFFISNRKRFFSKTITYVRNKEELQYGLACFLGEIIGVVYYFVKLVFGSENLNFYNIVMTAMILSFCTMLIISGKVFKIRKHPVTFVMVGWVIIAIVFVLAHLNVIKIEAITRNGTTIAFMYLLALFAIWLAVAMALSNRIQTRLFALFIILEYILLAGAVILYVGIEFPDHLIKTTAIIALSVPFLSVVSILILCLIRKVLSNHWKKVFSEKTSVIVLVVILAWVFLFGIICIVRWNGTISSKQEFFELLLECGAYISIAFFAIAFFCSVAILIYRTVEMLTLKKNKSAPTENNADIVLIGVLVIILLVGTGVFAREKFLINTIAKAESIPQTAQIPVSIILYVCVMMLISAVTVMVFKNSFSKNTFKQCKVYLENEIITRIVYKHYKKIKANGQSLEKAIKDTEEIIQSGEKIIKGAFELKTFFPSSMGNVVAIRIAMFSFEIRDFCFELVREVLGPFKSDGLVTGMIKDFVGLFTSNK